MKQVPASIIPDDSKNLLKGFEGGAVYTAEREGRFYLITDESTLSLMFEDDDLAGMDLVTCLEFETESERVEYIAERDW